MNEYLDIFNDVLRIATFQPGFRDRYHHACPDAGENRLERSRMSPREPSTMSMRRR
jgi:hypothetical protein